MKAIIISQEELDRLFDIAFRNYEKNYQFLHDNETWEKFKKTKRFDMLRHFKSTMKKFKFDIELSSL